jgi:hypothetical protein
MSAVHPIAAELVHYRKRRGVPKAAETRIVEYDVVKPSPYPS